MTETGKHQAPGAASRREQRLERQARVGILRNPNHPPRPPLRKAPLLGKWPRLRSTRRPRCETPPDQSSDARVHPGDETGNDLLTRAMHTSPRANIPAPDRNTVSKPAPALAPALAPDHAGHDPAGAPATTPAQKREPRTASCAPRAWRGLCLLAGFSFLGIVALVFHGR